MKRICVGNRNAMVFALCIRLSMHRRQSNGKIVTMRVASEIMKKNGGLIQWTRKIPAHAQLS
jgi:hypothetical protein